MGELSDEQLGALAPSCHQPCETVADCEDVRGGPYLCEGGKCVVVPCTGDGPCFGFNGEGTCSHNYCGAACSTDEDCPDYRELCRDGFCFKPLEEPQPRCQGDEDCGAGSHRLCRGENDYNPPVGQVNIERGCYCAGDGACHLRECLVPADCVEHSFGTEAADWSCDGGECVRRPCARDADCRFGARCDVESGFCSVGCTTDENCQLAMHSGLIWLRIAATCDAGSCSYERCERHADCSTQGAGACRRSPDGGPGYCAYWINSRQTCFPGDECPAGKSCRASNLCDSFLSQTYEDDSGASCDDDGSCQARYLYQHLLAGGLTDAARRAAEDQQFRFPGCGAACSGAGSCGDGLACVEGATAHEESGRRSFCLPEGCTAEACGASLRECGDDAGCPTGERCAFPIAGCAGVCLDLDCASCAAWHRDHAQLQCLTGAIEIDVVRQD